MFDAKLLRAFVTVADTGSFTAAAYALNATQSTISQQIGRLEEAIDQQLFERAARPVILTAAGERLIGHARRILALHIEARAFLSDPSGSRTIRVGLPDDMVTPDMSRQFADFSTRHREVRLDVTTGLSRDLSHRFRANEFDVAIGKESRAQSDARASCAEPLAWFEAAGRHESWPDPVPLVAFPAGGLYRDNMIERVEREGRRWYLAFTGNSLASILHAVEAGLGLSVLPLGAIGSRDVQRSSLFGETDPITLSVYAWEKDDTTAELVATMTQAVVRRHPGSGEQ